MKPRLFIGSSGESRDFAYAMHDALVNAAECTVWDAGFPPGGTTLGTLMERVQTTDFALFVFAPDDAIEMRGERYLVARDNVLYELGLFTGHLQPERCFFVLPDTISVHIPSDLLGVTHGVYEAGRSDRNPKAAVAPFCLKVKEQISKLGFMSRSLSIDLYDLAVKFECADWINPPKARFEERKRIVVEMVNALRRSPVDRCTLLKHDRLGFKILFWSAVRAQPTEGDDELFLSINPAMVPPGVAQDTMVYAIEALQFANLIAPKRRNELVKWLAKLPDDDGTLVERITRLNDSLAA